MQVGKPKKRTLDETNNCCRSRGRGYSWETALVKKFRREMEWGWDARRLGGSSTGLPDVVAVDNHDFNLLAIEAKSGTRTSLSVGEDQIWRCFTVCNLFRAYKKRYVVLAFKFSIKKRIKREFERRPLKTYYVVINSQWPPENRTIRNVTCNYGGRVEVKNKLLLPDNGTCPVITRVFTDFGDMLEFVVEDDSGGQINTALNDDAETPPE